MYDFALTTTWEPEAAEDAVRVGLRGVDPGTVRAPELFDRVRVEAEERAQPPESVHIDVNEPLPPPDELPVAMIESIALSVLEGIAPADRALLDLAFRRGLEGNDLADAGGFPPADASDRLREAQGRADHLLGHYVLARIGHDTCPRLRDALGEPAPDRLGPLAARVDSHLADCSLCTDRWRGLTPVTSMLNAIPARPAPDALHDALGHLWEKEDVDAQEAARRRRRWMGLAGVLAVVALAGSLIGAQLLAESSDSDVDVTATTLPTVLAADSSTIDLGVDDTSGTAVVSNVTERSLTYRVEVDVPWVTVTPSEGRLGPGEDAELSLAIDRSSAPEGEVVTTIRVLAGGAPTEINLEAEIPKGPEIAGVVVDPPNLYVGTCGVEPSTSALSATVTGGTGDITVVARTPSGDIPLTPAGEQWTGAVGPLDTIGDVPVTVVATDGIGKVATSVPVIVNAAECPAPPTTTRRHR